MINSGRHNILGIRISAVDYEEAVQQVVDAACQQQPLAVSALAVHGLMTGALDREHRYRLNQFDLLVPDGQPVRWALRWLHGVQLPDRVYGPTLMMRVCQRAAAEGMPIFLFGGTAELLEKLQQNLSDKFPRLQVAGARPSKFRRLDAEERDELVKSIRGSGAAITFVGLGCPRQEVWGYEFRDALSMPLLTVGAAFNFHAGVLSQAPRGFQDRGLEWLYRLMAEPRRLWKRYLLLNPLYLAMIAAQLTRLRSYSPEDANRPTEELLYG